MVGGQDVRGCSRCWCSERHIHVLRAARRELGTLDGYLCWMTRVRKGFVAAHRSRWQLTAVRFSDTNVIEPATYFCLLILKSFPNLTVSSNHINVYHYLTLSLLCHLIHSQNRTVGHGEAD